MTEYALLIAEEGEDVSRGRNKVDSRRKTLILDLEADPPHMQVVEINGGNVYTDNGTPLTGRSQDLLFSFKHKLGYAPHVDCYIDVISYNNDPNHAKVSGYGSDAYHLGAGNFADVVAYEADQQEFRLVHNFDRFGGSTGYTSDADKYRFRVKFYIYSIDTGRTINYGYPYDGSGNVIN